MEIVVMFWVGWWKMVCLIILILDVTVHVPLSEGVGGGIV
jgi:hypothetical protein